MGLRCPSTSLQPDGFAVRWQGGFDLGEGDYEFLVVADDGVRLVVDDVPLIDAWYPQEQRDHVVMTHLSAGTHRVQLDYFDASGPAAVELRWAPLQKPYFSYVWRADDSLTGEVSLPEAAPRPLVVLDGQPTLTLNSTAALRLADIAIVVVDDEEEWDASTVGLLYEMVRRLPQTRLLVFDAKPWRVTPTDAQLAEDVEVTFAAEGEAVNRARFSRLAFARSNPALQPSADGNADRVFYSNRLFRAVLRAFYDDPYLLEEILQSRYGVAVGTAEPADEFQAFTLDELRYLASVLEDLPSGFRNIPGLDKVVRRLNGLTNPTYPSAPAIAWVDLGYIEFMDIAFTGGDAAYIRRLIAHEMAHFLWRKVLDEGAGTEFLALSGWSTSPSGAGVLAASTSAVDHPKAEAGGAVDEDWYRSTTTNFASAYAAALNPDEDFAETLAYYVYEPDHLRTIAPAKYGFVADVVDGYEYVTLVDEQFTFQVFNLEPDFTFPGKIVGVEVDVTKSITGDNLVAATLRLSPAYGDGAGRASGRLFSTADTFVDVQFAPEGEDPFALRAAFPLDGAAAGGYWTIGQIVVEDIAGNRRFEGQDQFGWQLFADNPDEDLEAPIADLAGVRGETTSGGDEWTVLVRVPLADETLEGLGGYATLQHYGSGQQLEVYASYQRGTGEIVFSYPIRGDHASGEWAFREFWVSDKAGNQRRYDLRDATLSFDIVTPSPDDAQPELDIASIRVEAEPRNPAAPDGETDVTIRYRARDDNSGVGIVSYRLLKPTGGTLFDYHYHANFYTPYFVGVADEFADYRIDLTLPPGSPPGTWVLAGMIIEDKAGNALDADFIETGIVRTIVVGD